MYDESRNIRDMIDGELNRIAITDDTDEIIKMMGYLVININKYAEIAKSRIKERNARLGQYGDNKRLDL
jgi:hypothetical protein